MLLPHVTIFTRLSHFYNKFKLTDYLLENAFGKLRVPMGKSCLCPWVAVVVALSWVCPECASHVDGLENTAVLLAS